MNKDIFFDYSELKGKFRGKGLTQEDLAILLGMSKTSLSNKLNNKSRFDSAEILNLSKILEITDVEISYYFFRIKVQKTKLKQGV
ncbi:DUF739 family protein [uncultured Vagococcus sp.]|uniref:DUF739 family protein n=1 Tax=uncultured Vagococcus sp. TaxID=189676 RepID=UPI0028D6E3B7|nr:DUF739 family protein [uncultured Vagococcus sp.]